MHVAHVLPAVGEKLHLLVGLHALGLEQLKEAALGLFIVGLHPGKAPGRQLWFYLLVALKPILLRRTLKMQHRTAGAMVLDEAER